VKALLKLIFIFIIVIILVPVALLGWFGFIPGLSDFLGATKPKNLGIIYQEADLQTGREKSQIVYETTEEILPPEKSWQTIGKREVKTEFTSSEVTAIMNNKPGAYYPYKNVQVKFNADGSGEISGSLIKSRLPMYGATFGAPKVAMDFIMKFLPENPVFYLKGKATLEKNMVGLFEPQVFEISRIPMPLNLFLSLAPSFGFKVYAIDLVEMSSELSKVTNKKALIIDFINRRLSDIEGFFAESAYMTENKLIFKGTLPEKEIVTK